jgi:hypothetical protein
MILMSEKKPKMEKFKLLINVKYNSERLSVGQKIELTADEVEVFRKAGAIELEEAEDSEEA